MPYYITDESPDCAGWAVVKDDGEQLGCHETKEAAVEQMVAVSIAEGIEPGGERAGPDELSVGDYVRWDSSGGTARGRVTRIVREGTLAVPDTDLTLNADAENPAALIRVYRPSGDGWAPSDVVVGHRFRTLTKIDPLPEPSDDRSEVRQVDLTLPGYIRQAAARGLEFHAEGLSGDGVVASTVRDARRMADGEVSEEKVIRVSAWAARHAVDLQADGARPDEEGFPTPGAVAHYLWGIPTGGRYADARAWFDRKAEQIKDERVMVDVTPVSPRSEGSSVEFRETTGELRAETDGRFSGYAAMFDRPSQPLPFVERIAPGAFDRSLRNRKRDVRLYVNHNSDLVLASRRSGTLELAEDGTGLRVDAELPNTSYANDLRELMAVGVVDKMSFGFSVARNGDEWSEDGSERVLKAVTLHEVSVVTGFPAYESTSAALRTLERVSLRTKMPVDDLVDVLNALGDGEPIDAERAEALLAAVKVAKPDEAPDALGLKAKRLELLAKKV